MSERFDVMVVSIILTVVYCNDNFFFLIVYAEAKGYIK